MNKFRKKIILVFTIIVCLSVVCILSACNHNNNNLTDASGNTVYSLEFYRSRANNMTMGDAEDEVKKALEDKFFEDTGIKVSLKMNVLNGEDLTQKVSVGVGNSKVKIDAFLSQISADSASSLVYKYCIDPYGSAKDLTELIEKYGQDYLKAIRSNDPNHLVERAGYYMIDGEMQYKALASVYNTNYYALMLRKDYWVQAYNQGKTTLDPEDYDTSNDNYKHLTLNEFESVMLAIKETVEEVTYPVTGYSWDLARTIGSSCFNTKLNWVKDSNENIIPYQISEEYGMLLELCKKWAQNGIWEKDSSSIDDDKRTNNFLAGKHAAYIVYPDVEQLIIISNRLKAYDDDSECMLIAPIKLDENTDAKGFYTQPAAFQGLCVPFDGNNTEVLIKFINWLYSDTENYELAKYGIKGVHWVEGSPYTVTIDNETYTYKTWSYPANKMDEYQEHKPYSGSWELLVNINMSERINDSWSPLQKQWYVYATKVCEKQNTENSIQGIMLPEIPTTLNSNNYTSCISDATVIYGSAIVGKNYKTFNTITDAILAVKNETISTANNVLSYYKEKYNEYMNWFEENLD